MNLLCFCIRRTDCNRIILPSSRRKGDTHKHGASRIRQRYRAGKTDAIEREITIFGSRDFNALHWTIRLYLKTPDFPISDRKILTIDRTWFCYHNRMIIQRGDCYIIEKTILSGISSESQINRLSGIVSQRYHPGEKTANMHGIRIQQAEIRHILARCGDIHRIVYIRPTPCIHIIRQIGSVRNIHWLGNEPVVLYYILLCITIVMRW